MIDYLPTIISTLSDAADGAKVYYEAFEDKAELPCISVLEAANASRADGDTLRYSTLAFQVRIWTTRVSELQSLSLIVDKAMYGLGFTRTSAQDIFEDGYITKVLRFEATSYERI